MNIIQQKSYRFKEVFNINKMFFNIIISSIIIFLLLFNFYKITALKILIFIINILLLHWILYFTNINNDNSQPLDHQINQLFNEFIEKYNEFKADNINNYQLNQEIQELQNSFNQIIPLDISEDINYQDIAVELSILNKKLQDKIQPIVNQNEKNLEEINNIHNNITNNISSMNQYNNYHKLIESDNQVVSKVIDIISDQIKKMDNKVLFERDNHIILFKSKNTLNKEGYIDYIPIVDYSIIYKDKEIIDLTYIFDQDVNYYYNQQILLVNNQDIQMLYGIDGLFVLDDRTLYHFNHKFTTVDLNNIKTIDYNQIHNGIIKSAHIKSYTDIIYLDFNGQNNLKKYYKYNNISIDHPINNKFVIFHNNKYLMIIYLDIKKIYKYSKGKKIVI